MCEVRPRRILANSWTLRKQSLELFGFYLGANEIWRQMDEVGLEGVYRPEKLQFWLMVRPQKSSRLGEVLDNVIVFCRILWNV